MLHTKREVHQNKSRRHELMLFLITITRICVLADAGKHIEVENRRNSVHLFRGYFSRRDDDRRGITASRTGRNTDQIDVLVGRLRL